MDGAPSRGVASPDERRCVLGRFGGLLWGGLGSLWGGLPVSKRHKMLSRERHAQVVQRLCKVTSVEQAVLRGHLYLEY